MTRLATAAAVLLALGAAGCSITPLHGAIRANDAAEARRLLRAGASVRQPGGTVPYVDWACQWGNLEVLESLVEAGADVNDTRGMTHLPLYDCLILGKKDMARYLVEHGAHLGSSDGDAEPLLAALASGPRTARTAAAAPVPAAAEAPTAPTLVSDIDRAQPRGVARPDDFALVVGVEDYQSLPRAQFGARDAAAARRHFAALGIPERNIVALEGQAATGNKLKSYLQEWLPLNVKADSTLWVYYSGHGAPDPKNGDAYLVPWDGDPKFLKSTAYPLKQFYADLAKTKAKRIVVALDACFSGAGGRSVLAEGTRPLVVKVEDGAPASDRLTVFAAASGDETTGTMPDEGHGAFTYYFLKGLSGAAKSAAGAVTAKSLYDYLKPRVQDEAHRQNREQTPLLLGQDATF